MLSIQDCWLDRVTAGPDWDGVHACNGVHGKTGVGTCVQVLLVFA